MSSFSFTRVPSAKSANCLHYLLLFVFLFLPLSCFSIFTSETAQATTLSHYSETGALSTPPASAATATTDNQPVPAARLEVDMRDPGAAMVGLGALLVCGAVLVLFVLRRSRLAAKLKGKG